MAENGNLVIEEQRVCCKICTQLGIPPKEIKANLNEVYCDKVYSIFNSNIRDESFIIRCVCVRGGGGGGGERREGIWVHFHLSH